MTHIKIQLTDRLRALGTGDKIGPYDIAYSNDGGPHAIIDIPDDMTEEEIDAEMQRLAKSNLIANDGRGLWRYTYGEKEDPGHIWTPAWIEPDPVRAFALTQQYEAGDTFPTIGISEDVKARGKYGAGIRIGHVDTWTDTSHSWLGKTVCYAEGRGPDDQSHGTHTACTIVGEYGVCRDAELYTFNGLPQGAGTELLIAQGIDWCADNNVHVISLSLGGGGPSQLIGQSVMRARARGALVISACGNSGGRANPPGSPQRESTYTVLACTRDNPPVHAQFTDGRNWNTPNRVYTVGVDVVSAFPHESSGGASGTSMSCPQLAGACGLLLASGIPADTI